MKERFETFTVQIAKISRNIRRIKTHEMMEFNLKSPHVSCLYYLYRNGAEMTAKELCDACDEDKASMSRSIEQLENLGLITCNSKTYKRYNSPLALTAKGREVGNEIAKKVDNIVKQASLGLSEENRKIFYEALILISNNLSRLCEGKAQGDEI